MRPWESGDNDEAANIRSAVQDAIQRRVHSLMLETDLVKRKPDGSSRLVGTSLSEDVVSVACRVLDNVGKHPTSLGVREMTSSLQCIQAKSLDTTDVRLQLQFVRRMLSKAAELDTVAAQLGNQATRDLLVTQRTMPNNFAQVAPIRLTQHLKEPLPQAARGGKSSAAKPSTTCRAKQL
ncbi:hypothetical protein H310_06103 [Aphanomyces invadans]|uniref:Uncharacterized protein n=1 Tax=Aphanomyces invadans TaxID=157072 RepID=A0A024U870_9STRA|nr:hypothetical protein H310_06103 [Aphanomyces invadans]ETW02641.1 hypothetical protein H310_06103 [Aphanomyces invadans]|eukprot:XP_008869246.1 hypothetical protein H310_06103 [Aphanomyces invadans]